MQAKNDQNWTDDGAFWDEAWTDMNRRLDENPPRRKRRVAWWWFTGAFLALLLVVTPVALAGVFSGDSSPEAETTPLKVPAPHPAAAPEKEVYAAQTVTTPGPRKPESHEPTTKAAPRTTPPLRLPTPNVHQKTAEKDNSFRASITPVPTAGAGAVLAVAAAAIPPPSLPDESPVEVKPPRNVPAAIGMLAQTDLTAFPLPNTLKLPTIMPRKNRRKALYLEAGALATAGPNASGYYAGVGYRFRLGERLSLPFSVRYRHEDLPVGDFPVSGSSDLFNLGTATDTSDMSGTPVTEAYTVSFTSLRTESVEVTTGISYAFTPRFRASAGLSVAYLTKAQLYVSTVPTGNQFGAENTVNLLNSLGEIRVALDPSVADLGEISFPDLNPLQFSGRLGVSYELTRRLGISATSTYLLQQPDRAKMIGLPAVRSEIGLRWRLF